MASYDLSIFVLAKLPCQLKEHSQAILNNFILKFNTLLLEMLWYQYNKNILVSPPTPNKLCQVTGKVKHLFSLAVLEFFTNNDYCLSTWLTMAIIILFLSLRKNKQNIQKGSWQMFLRFFSKGCLGR